MRYIVLVNDDEARDNGDDLTLEEATLEIKELLRSGYFEVEHVWPGIK